jgi:hypothetical protein
MITTLCEMEGLRRLDLSETNVTDAGIDKLVALKNLDVLRLYKTGVTVAAINKLQSSLPSCHVDIDAGR